MPGRLGLLAEAFVLGSALRPLATPVVPTLDAVRNALEIVEIDAVGDETRLPVVDGALHKLISRHE